MAEENTAGTSGGVNRRTIIIIAAAGLAVDCRNYAGDSLSNWSSE